uniref:RING-type domain-containing protein n=1 Tax=Salix viminalis TaxID=40686 RepID=A0A6N2JXP6_SALVM
MASSQIEIASSSPFGCVLRDHNRHERFNRESTARAAAAAAAFQKNLKGLVRENLRACISVSSESVSNENPRNRVDSNIDDHHQNSRRLTDNKDNIPRNVHDSSIRSSKQARTLDQWAAMQARGMISTIEMQREKAGLLITSLKKPSSMQQNSQDSENSAGQSDNPPINKNRGASSLVQIWEARLNQPEACLHRSHSMNNSRTGSVSSQTENASSNTEEKSRQSDIADSNKREEAFEDCGSAKSAPSSIHFRNRDAGEPEKVKIVDIIRRLTSDGNDPDQPLNSAGDGLSRERKHSSGSDRTEQKVLSQVVNSPKIRGRQAFNDLLLQMEQERHRELGSLGERQAVSKFAQRGRIQSLLRLRFLHRGVAFEDQHRPRSSQSTTSSISDRSQHGSTIMHLRERFSAGTEQATSLNEEPATPRSTAEMLSISVDSNTSIQNQPTADGHHQENSASAEKQSEPQVKISASTTCEVQEKADGKTCAGSDVAWEGTSLQVENLDPPETSKTTSPLSGWEDHEVEEEEGYFEQTSSDWFSDIARPRSYWEDQRRARYEEKLSGSSDNDEIRQLLERRTVSSFLTSDLRDSIDQLVMSRVQRQVSQEDEELDEDSQERMGQLMLSYFQRHSHSADSQDEEQKQGQELDGGSGEGETVGEESISEEGSLITSHQYIEATDYFDQSSPSQHSPYPFRSWNFSDEHEVADGCQQAQTKSLHLTPPSQVSNKDRRYSSSISHSSIEMELLYDLKGHMVQLQREMSGLRKSIQSCMEMQMNSQNYLKVQEVHPVQGNGKSSSDRRLNKRSCCICYETHVDSFLYRCGHMCTCLKCAHELLRSGGKCPICRAPILDVVRACLDS